MLTVEIGYRQALPLRAIPFCSHGCISALDVAAFLANPEAIPGEFDERTYQDPDHPLTRYNRTPIAFRIGPMGAVDRLPPGVFHSIPKVVTLAMEAPDVLAPIKALPPGIFVWLDEIRVLFDFLDYQFTRQEENARGFVENFREWRDVPALPIDATTVAMILEGVEPAIKTTKGCSSVKRSGMGGTNPEIQAFADTEADRVFKATGRYPKKTVLAQHIEQITKRKACTVMREFRSPKRLK